jgi:hypothetical protein
MPINDARMYGAFIHLAPIGIGNRGAQHDGSYWRKGERRDDEKRQRVPDPWECFMWRAVHNPLSGLRSLVDDSMLLSPIPKRGELRRLFLMLKMRPVVIYQFPKRHSVSASTIYISAALEQK